MSCTRSQEFLATAKVAVGEKVLANKAKLGPKDALALARGASDLWAAKGKKVVHLRPTADKVSDEDLLAVMLGPTGNLRAPTIRLGKKLVVGFNTELYSQLLGK